ncbi:electron transporter RnfE [hot springs metagenome]|uniref:Electron transporter RnfE n=1 Tax=hot springs metagenome TaxID=433727 RepID=A0A5J4KY29_9ZZZZ
MFWGNHGWGMGFGAIFMVLFWVLVILGVIYLVQLIAKGQKRETGTDTALDIIRKRYAKGEITKEEFEKLRDDLTKT